MDLISTVNIQWPVWICGSLLTTFQLTISVEVSHIHRRIQSLLFQTSYPGLNSWTVCINNPLSYRVNWFLSSQTSHLIIQRFHHFWKSLHPFPGSLRGFHVHFLRTIENWKAVHSMFDWLVQRRISWSRWTFTFPVLILTSGFAISFFTSPMNTRPGSTWRTKGHLNGPLSLKGLLQLAKTLWKWVVQRLWISGNIDHRRCTLKLPHGSRSWGRKRRSA